MTLVEAICPDLPANKIVKATLNDERWFHIVNDVLYVPTDHTVRGNFILLDKMIEALNNFVVGPPPQGWWDDTRVDGKTFFEADECMEAIDFLKTQKVLAVDIESRNLGYDGNRVLLIGFAYSDYESVVIANFAPDVLGNMQLLFDKEDITFIWHNGKFDTSRLVYLLQLYSRVDEDTMLQHYVGINERKGTHALKDLGPLYLQAPQWDDELDNYKRKWCTQHGVKIKEFQYDMIPLEILIPYSYRDTCATFQLNKKFNMLMRQGSLDIYRKLIKASNVFREIELAGCLIDNDYMYELQDKLDDLILDAERHVKAAVAISWDARTYAIDSGAKSCPKSFNHKSPKQLKWMLEQVTQRKLANTTKETLELLFEEFPEVPFISAISALRKYNKYMDTYVSGLQKVTCEDGRVRCTFKLLGTETGRLSCSGPNMQNIPRTKLIKNVFVAPPGYKLVQLDYSQAELRVLAWLSQDEYLREVYRDGKDLHDAMSLKIFGEDFTKEQRVAAKTVNFGIPYGRGPGSIKGKLRMSMYEATKLIKDWYKAAPGAEKFVNAMRKEPYKAGEPYTTVFGRQRHYIITSDNRNHIENEAVNFPVSSIASDLTMLSVCEIRDKMLAEDLNARIVNTVHDSIIIECIDDSATLQRVVDIGTAVMANMPTRYLLSPPLDFPFVADAEIGQSWGDLEDADKALEQEMAGYGDNESGEDAST